LLTLGHAITNRSFRRAKTSVAMLLLLCSIPIAPECASAKTLQVGIEHSVVLDPVPVDLQPGKIFQTHKKAPMPDRWAIIPANTAGKWKLIRKFDVSNIDLRSGKRSSPPADQYGNSVTYIGYQSDKEGQIWTSADIESKLPHSNGTYLVPALWELKQTSDHSFTVIKRGVSLTVDPQSHQIQDAKQIESFAIFDVVAPNKLIQKYSTQWFDANGEAIKLTEGQTEMDKTGDFEPVNELNGIDIKSSFRRFLREQ
jgi:hypothetical protein